MDTGTIAVILIFGTGLVAVAGKAIVSILKALRENPGPEARRAMDDEIQMMRDLAHGLEKMEERIEALETILQDRGREGDR